MILGVWSCHVTTQIFDFWERAFPLEFSEKILVGTFGQDLLLRWHPSPCIVTCLTTQKLPNKLMQSIEPIDYCQLEQDICILFQRTEISDAAMHILKSRSFVDFDHGFVQPTNLSGLSD
jgi:hypothetical protein